MNTPGSEGDMMPWDYVAGMVWDLGAFALLTAEGLATEIGAAPDKPVARHALDAGVGSEMTVEEFARRVERSYYELAALAND